MKEIESKYSLKSHHPKKNMRMCICCRARRMQKELLRLCLRDGKVAIFCGFGRSFYLCRECKSDPTVFKKILKIKKLSMECEDSLKEIVNQWNK